MDFIPKARRRCNSVLLKMKKAGKIVIDPSSITKVSIGMGKNKKVDINNIVLVAKK